MKKMTRLDYTRLPRSVAIATYRREGRYLRYRIEAEILLLGELWMPFTFQGKRHNRLVERAWKALGGFVS